MFGRRRRQNIFFTTTDSLNTVINIRLYYMWMMCLPPGTLSSTLALPSIPEFPRLGGMVLLRLTGALSMGTTLPAMNCEPATLWRFSRFAG